MRCYRALHFAALSALLISGGCELAAGGTDTGQGALSDDDDASGQNQQTSPSTDVDGATPGTSDPAKPGPSGTEAGATTPAGDSGASAAKDASSPTGSDGAVSSDAGTSKDAATPSADARVDAGVDPTPNRRCGTRGGVTCAPMQFCNFEPDVACGATDRGGVCETKPQACTDQWDPVCGCDNRTYPNECEAHAAGVSIKSDASCTPDDCKAAGGTPKYSTGADNPKCGANDDQWPLSGGIEPVICCRKRPPEPKPGKTCGGIASLECDDGKFCNYEPAAGGQGCDGRIADAAGVCEALPTGCTKEYQPVCGCDGKTYSNACMAHFAGASVKRTGTCQRPDCVAMGGMTVTGIGTAPRCPAGWVSAGWIPLPDPNSGAPVPIEGAICCIKQ